MLVWVGVINTVPSPRPGIPVVGEPANIWLCPKPISKGTKVASATTPALAFKSKEIYNWAWLKFAELELSKAIAKDTSKAEKSLAALFISPIGHMPLFDPYTLSLSAELHAINGGGSTSGFPVKPT